MSTDVSNLYAMRIYRENPISLWPLDDNMSFISLLSASGKSVYSWSLSSASFVYSSSSALLSIKMPDETLSRFTGNMVNSASATSPAIYRSTFDENKKSLTISSFLWQGGAARRYKIGFLYDVGGSLVKTTSTIPALRSFDNWQKIHHTIDLPNSSSVFYGFLEVEYFNSPNQLDYHIYLNGLSVGQWSEDYNSITTGFFPKNLNQSSSSAQIYSLIPSSSVQYKYQNVDIYGANNKDSGYYLIEGNKMLSSNTGMPMLYGSSNITKIYPPIQNNIPSIIMPGSGFLNELGKYNDITMEFWLRIYNKHKNLFRIFGPLKGDDGLYVDGEFLTLRIGSMYKSYFVGKWYRPMLVDICYSPSKIVVYINGDSVMEMNLNINETKFSSVDDDWIGFYANENCQPMEIDCVAIYPYFTPQSLIKRRFVYGQGLEAPDLIASQFIGENAYVDFSFAQYATNIEYPLTKSWSSGYSYNMDFSPNSLSLPEYVVPQFKTDTSASTFLLFEDNLLYQNNNEPTFISMQPDLKYTQSNVNSSFYINNLSVIKSPVNSVLGVFKNSASVSSSAQIIMRFGNKSNNKNFRIEQQSSSVVYIYNNGAYDRILNTSAIQSSSAFIAGINIPSVAKSNALFLDDFFNDIKMLDLSIMGYESNTYSGKMYSLTLNGANLINQNEFNYFDSNGFANINSGQISVSYSNKIFNYIGNYTLVPIKTSKTIELDVASKGYWETYLPLSYFATYVTPTVGEKYYDLDLIQFNIDYPSSIVKNGNSMSNVDVDADVKVYATLQYFKDVGSIPYRNWVSASSLYSDRVIDFDNTLDVTRSKYELIDGTIIFPPKQQVDFNEFYIGIHIEMQTKSVSKRKINLSRMRLASLSYNQTSFFSLKTKTSLSMYPFVRRDSIYSFTDKNPFLISRETMPYLYLSDDSGLTVLKYDKLQNPRLDVNATKGISIPVNQKLSNDYKFSGIQMWGMYNFDYSFDEEKIVASLALINDGFYLKIIPENNNKRAKMKVFSTSTNKESDNVSYYQNGIKVDYFTVQPLLWNAYHISFGNSYLLSNSVAQFEFYEGMIFNNVSYFEESLDIVYSSFYKQRWSEILGENNNWNSYGDTWGIALNRGSVGEFSVPGNEIFNTYLGLSTIVARETSRIALSEDKGLLMEAKWKLYEATPL